MLYSYLCEHIITIRLWNIGHVWTLNEFREVAIIFLCVLIPASFPPVVQGYEPNPIPSQTPAPTPTTASQLPPNPFAPPTLQNMSLQSEPASHPVQRVQAPWPLKAESYLLFLKMKELPKGLYDSLEKVWEGGEFGAFEGGLGAIMIVRYWDTPVGMSTIPTF
jgi:hypothetical protein